MFLAHNSQAFLELKRQFYKDKNPFLRKVNAI